MRPLEHFKFCPRCGKSAAADSGKSICCAHCGFVLFMNVASAVGAIIPDHHGRILLLRRANEPRKGKLGAPGGFMDAGESVEVALRREVMEEVNLEVANMQYLFSHPNDYAYRGVKYPTADLFFLCTVKSFSTLQALDEVETIEFADPQTLDPNEIAFSSLHEAIGVYLKSTRHVNRTSSLPS